MAPQQKHNEDPSNVLNVHPMVIVVAGTLMVVLVAIVVFIVLWRKTKLNWYEKNLLELAKEDAQIIRYNKKDDDDDDESRLSNYSLHQKERRKSAEKAASVEHSEHNDISPARQFTRLYGSLPSLDNVSIGSLDVREKRVQPADVSDKFFVPKSHVTACSMFRTLDMSKIDKELYDSSRHDCYPTEDPVLGQCGSVQMALNYDTTVNLLRVRLLQASNLTARKTSNSPNPHFKLTLFPPDNDSPKQSYQTKVYKNQRSPKLGDEFCFDITSGHLSQYNLQILTFDFDQYTVDECIGCCWLCLNRVDISTDNTVKTVFWLEVMPMESEDNNSNVGEILFSLSYLSKAQRLIVTIMEARNLVTPDDMTEPPDPCLKVTIICNGKRLKHKRTSVKRATYNPNFTEALTFNVPKPSLCDVILSFVVYHEPHAFRSGKQIGKFEIPLNKCKELWRAVIKGEDSKPKWYPLEKA